MLIDGQKWACEACIRGHRVSGCTHADRELKPIAKKGRPVSQCPHCRQLRKSRSAHVKCECGEKFSSKKDNATKCGGSGDKSNKPTTKDCLCCHGGRCICALKKEPTLDPVPENPSNVISSRNISPSMTEPRRPRLQSTQSESSLTTFANGHHKPTHKHHGVHGTSPYTIPVHSSIADVHNRHSFLDSEEPRSKSAIHSPMLPKARRTKSEQSSPDILSHRSIKAFNCSGDPSPLELTPNRCTAARLHIGLSVNTSQSAFTLHDYPSQELLLSAASETLPFSGFQPSLASGWPSFLDDSATHIEDSATPYDWLNYPGLTGSSSGDENDDLNSVRTTTDTLYGNGSTNGLRSDASDLAENDTYRLSAASSYIGLPQAGLMAANGTDELNWSENLLFTLMSPESNLSLERYLAEVSPKQSPYGLVQGSLGEPMHDDEYDFCGIFLSSIQSPIESGPGGIGGQTMSDDDGLLFMRPWNM